VSNQKQIFTRSIVAVGLVLFGLYIGIWANKTLNVTTESPSQTEIPAPNTTLYNVSPPSKGRINFTFPIKTVPTGPVTYLTLPSEEARHLEQGQLAFLYNEKDQLIPIIGKLIDVIKGEGANVGTTAIRVEIKDTPESPLSDVAHIDIIVGVLKYAQRLPLSALVHHNDESAHVWEVIRADNDSRTAKLRSLPHAPISFDDFFILPDSEYISNVYILNPDASLEDGQTIITSENLYHPSAVPNPDTIIDEMKFKALLAPERIVMPPDNSACADTPNAMPSSSSCGGNSGTINFIERIKQMARDEAAKANR
jgi:hypothetical protein